MKGRLASWKGSNNWIWLLMSLPAVIFILIFCYIPMPGVILAFKNFNYAKGLMASPWAGLTNFKFFFNSPDFGLVTRNTLVMNILFLVVDNFVSVAFAVLLNEVSSKRLLKTFQTIMFFPYFLSWVVVGYMLYSFLNMDYGIANRFLSLFGVQPVGWYLEDSYWPFILLFISIWKGTGQGSVIYYASIIGIDQEYFEAAEIDGANKLQTTLHITLPFLYPIISLFLLLGIGQVFKADFGMFYILPQNSSLLYNATQVIDTYVYNALKNIGNIGMATAVGLYQSFMGFVIVIVMNSIVRKIQPENSLF